MRRSMNRPLAALAALSLALLSVSPSGCGPLDDCLAICDAAASCVQEFDAQSCATECHAGVDTYGQLAASVVADCRACVMQSSCAGLIEGDCDGACPSALPGISHDPQPPGGCSQSWPDAPGFRVDCDGYDGCRCFVGGVEADVFTSPEFCGSDDLGRRSIASRGCGWALPVCTASWSGADGEHLAACRWQATTATSMICECDIAGQYAGEFSSDKFCDLPPANQIVAGQSSCPGG